MNTDKEPATLKTIAVRKPGPVRLTRAAVYCYGCCCCVRARSDPEPGGLRRSGGALRSACSTMEMTIVALSLDMPALQFHRLSFVPDGDEVVVGRRDIDSYGVVPPDGAALVRELDSRPVAARRRAAGTRRRTASGSTWTDFLAVAGRLGFLRADDEPMAGDAPAGPLAAVGRSLFSPLAALLLAVVVTAVVLASDPAGARPAAGQHVLHQLVRGGGAHHRHRPAPAVGDPRARPPSRRPPAGPGQQHPPVQPLLLRRVRDDAGRAGRRAASAAVPADARRDGRRPRRDGLLDGRARR